MTVAAAATFALVAADFENATGGVIGGGGTIDVDGSFTNNGPIKPGTSPRALAIDGEFVHGVAGPLMVEIDGRSRETGRGQVRTPIPKSPLLRRPRLAQKNKT